MSRSRLTTPAFLCAVVLLAPAGASAQAPACALDSTAHSRTIELYLSLGIPDSVKGAQRQSYLALAIAISSAFQQPSPLSLPVWPGTFTPYPSDFVGSAVRPWFGLGGYLSFEIRRDGRLQSDRVRASSGSPQLAAALEAAVRQVDRIRGFPALNGPARPRDGRVLFELRESLQPQEEGVAIVRVQIRGLRVDRPAVLLKAGEPRYPVAALNRKPTEGYAHFQFVIGADGAPLPQSFTLLETNYREFADASYRGLLESTFQPAMIGDCPVPILVHQRVSFVLQH